MIKTFSNILISSLTRFAYFRLYQSENYNNTSGI